MPLPDIPTGIEKKCNDALDAVVAYLATYQADYANLHDGRYWQGIKSHPVTPRDGDESAPDKSRKPTDQVEDWSNVTLSANMPIAVEVHVHDGPNGTGWTVFGWIEIAGRLWQRAVGAGAHSETYDWRKILRM